MSHDVKSAERMNNWVPVAPSDPSSRVYEADFTDGHRRYGFESNGQINTSQQCSASCKLCYPTTAAFLADARAMLTTPSPYQQYLQARSKTA